MYVFSFSSYISQPVFSLFSSFCQSFLSLISIIFCYIDCKARICCCTLHKHERMLSSSLISTNIFKISSVVTFFPAKLHLTQVLHKGFIKVDRSGVNVRDDNPSLSLKFPDHNFQTSQPFIFFVRDSYTNLIIYQGKFSH